MLISGGGSGSAWNETGRSARSFAKMPSRSGRIHCSMSPRWMSSSERSVLGIVTVMSTSLHVADVGHERRDTLVGLGEQRLRFGVDRVDRPRRVGGRLGDRTPAAQQ